MAFARTLRGDVAPELLGVINAHDHLIRIGAGEVFIDADHQLDSVEKAVEEAAYFVSASRNWSDRGGTVVDMCPINCGRDVERLAEVESKVDGLQVILATGFHQEKVYLETQSHWINRYSVDKVAELVIADITKGIDKHDYSGPIVERTPYRAGVIKVATSYGKITKFEHKCIQAAAIASIETGCPINTHTSGGTCGLEQAELMISLGVPADRIAIGHIQRNADIWYLTQILKTGVYLELDGTARLKYQPESNRIMEFRELGEAGYGDRLLLGTDSGKRSYQKAYGATTGIDYNPAVDGPRMIDEGFDKAYVEKLLMLNAQTFFTFRKQD